jgi:hypothetical protein
VLHTITHWLDDLRGALGQSTFSWNSVRGNIGAIPWQFALLTPLTLLLWPRVRRALEKLLKNHVTTPLKEHFTAGHKELHAKLDLIHAKQDHIIKHHPDIPPFPEGATMSEVIRAGRVGPFRESHEPRLNALTLIADGVTPVVGFLEYDGRKGIGNNDWGMDNNGPDPTNPPFMPDGAGDCGFAAKDHYDVAKMGDKTLAGLSFSPLYPTLLDAYWAYGISQGEQGPHPDLGVDNANFLAWLYKTGQIKGYAEVPIEYLDWFASHFTGVLLGLAIDGQVASNDFNMFPRHPWDAMAKIDGHDVLGIVTHADGTGALVTWGGLISYTLAFRQTNITDVWVIFDQNDPFVNDAALIAALNAIHGVVPV